MPLRTYLVNKNENKKFRIDGLVRSTHLPKEKHLCQHFRHHMLFSPHQLPPKADLRSKMTPVEDQSRIASW
jgi:hypothetical protein